MHTLIMPMGGAGSRFEGYTDRPKPFIDVAGLPMFIRSLSCMPLDDIRLAVFICAKGHSEIAAEMYRAAKLQGFPVGLFLEEDEPMGVAHCVQKAKLHIPIEESGIIIHHSDQYIEWYGTVDYFKDDINGVYDGVVPLWRNTEKMDWGFAIVDDNSPIGIKKIHPKKSSLDFPYVLCGCSFFRDAGEYFESLAQMEVKDLIGNEIYVESTYNKMINRGLKVRAHFVERVFGMGTPEELNDTLLSGVFE